MVSKELLEKARKCTTKEEILELAKAENVEVSDDEINVLLASTGTNKELSDDELENVAGGTCHSDYSFKELGITPETPYGGYQDPSYHPVITTAGNYCSIHPGFWAVCGDCKYHHTIGPTIYCKARSKEFDPEKTK